MTRLNGLARIEHLLAGLPGPYGNEHLWTSTGLAGTENLFTALFGFLTRCEVIDSASSFGDPPQNEEELAARLAEMDEHVALADLVGMTSRTLAYGRRGRYPADKANDIFGKLTTLRGHATRWWTNTDLSSWNPVTKLTMDALVVGTGGGVVVAVLAADED